MNDAQEDAFDPRVVRPGDFVVPKGGGRAEFVKSVSVILHLDNGVDEVYRDTEQIQAINY